MTLFSGNKNVSKSSVFSLQNVTNGRASTILVKKVLDTNGFFSLAYKVIIRKKRVEKLENKIIANYL